MRAALIFALALTGCHPLEAVENGQDSRPGGTRGGDALASPVEDGIMEGGTTDARGLGVIDGDTFELNGEVIRISNIDAPEMPPRSRCWAEARLAREATKELQRIQQEGTAGGYRMTPSGIDQYGRTLGRVSYNGGLTDAGEAMVERGYAVPWTGKRWDWCGPVTADPNGARVLAAGPSQLQEFLDLSAEDAATPKR